MKYTICRILQYILLQRSLSYEHVFLLCTCDHVNLLFHDTSYYPPSFTFLIENTMTCMYTSEHIDLILMNSGSWLFSYRWTIYVYDAYISYQSSARSCCRKVTRRSHKDYFTSVCNHIRHNRTNGSKWYNTQLLIHRLLLVMCKQSAYVSEQAHRRFK